MTMLKKLVQTPVAQTLGLTLFHTLWEGALAAAALLLVLCFIRSSRLRYAAACVTLLAVVAGFALTFAHFLPGPGGTLTAISPQAVAARPASAQTFAILQSFGRGLDLAWLAPIWILGVLLLHLHGVIAWLAARKLRYRGICPAPDEWLKRLAGLQPPGRSIALLESCLTRIPVVIGHLRPVILLPVGMLTSMSADQIEAILVHELAHIRRSDYLANLMQTIVEGFLFYHPAVWWISSVIRAERENCCDDDVIAAGHSSGQYARTLAGLEQTRWKIREVALAASGSSLARRIRRLLAPNERSFTGAPAALPAAVLIAVAAVALSAWQAPPEVTGPFAKWLNEEVAYIISDAERTAFLNLRTPAEQEQFVEQFWLRRDPTPGTPENEMKNEHYRRFAYANQHYASGVPGWRTDRGRIYITHGPPDEIDSHPYGGTGTYPFEQWKYRYIEGVGNNVVIDFVDSGRNGDYLMTRDPNEKFVK